MTTDPWIAFAAGALLGSNMALYFFRWMLKRTNDATNPQETDTQETDTKNLSSLRPKAGCWWADTSGTRLELADTGFYITFHASEKHAIYQGHTPEHLRMVTGPNLGDMKKYLEGLAAERAEFTPQRGWKP